jgi:GAF domain-containing protein
MIIEGSELSQTLAALCAIVETHAPGTARAAIMLTDRTGKHLHTVAAPSLPQSYIRAVDGIAIAADVGTCSAAAARRCVIVTRDFAKDPGWARLAHLPLAIGLRGAWSMPIFSSQGTMLGTFGTYFTEVREPTLPEQQLVGGLVRVARLAIERQRVDEGARHDRFLAELAAAIQPLAEPAAIMTVAAQLLAEHLQVDRCADAEIEDEATLMITGDHCRGVPSIVGRWPMAGFGNDCVRCLQAGQAFVVNDVEQDVRIAELHLAAYRAMQAQAVIWMPLHKAGKLTAAVSVQQVQMRRWSEGDIELLGLVVPRCWEALERARVTRTLHESEAKSRARSEYAVRLSGVGFWYCDLPFDELLWDERVKEHFFFPPQARITIEDFYARLHIEDRAPTL